MTLDRSALFAEIEDLIRRHSAEPDAAISAQTKITDLGVDSIDLMEIVFRLEETHGVAIDVEQLAGVETINDIVDFARNKITA